MVIKANYNSAFFGWQEFHLEVDWVKVFVIHCRNSDPQLAG